MFRSPSPRRTLTVLALLLTTLTSCNLVGAVANAPSKVLNAGSSSKEPVPPSALQAGVMRYADTFAALIMQATQDFAKRGGTPEAQIQGMTWVVGQNTAAFTIASGSNPNANLLDMIVLVTLGRMVHEKHWMQVWGEADRPMLEVYAALESDIWRVAEQVLPKEQQEAVRATLAEWCATHPDMALTAFVKLPAFEDMFEAKGQGTSMLGGLGDLLTVDPLAGLEPTVRQIEQARIFAERTLFFLQRMPLVLQVQAELMALKLAQMPDVRRVLDGSERISEAATSIAATAASLPESVKAEREAAVNQISGELTVQREGLVRDLEGAQAPLRELLAEAQGTLDSGAQMSQALQGAIQAFDLLMERFQKKAPDETEPAPPPPATETTGTPAVPSKPFDIGDYGLAAAHIGDAADQLGRLVTTLDQSLPQAQKLLDEVAARGERTIDHAFARGLGLGVLLIATAALAVLLVRRISRGSLRSTPS